MILPPQVKALWAAGKLWFVLGFFAAALLAGVYLGNRWERANTAEALRERDNAVQVANQWKDAATNYRAAVIGWQKRYAADEQAAARQRDQADQLLRVLAAQKEKADREREAWKARYAAAIKTPDCAELIKETKCAAFFRY